MIDSRKFEEQPKYKIKQISTIEQLANSYLVAEVLIETRIFMEQNNKNIIHDLLPTFNYKNNRFNELFYKAMELYKTKPAILFIIKEGFDDMVALDFKGDPSVVSVGSAVDTAHLRDIVGPRFADLRNVNLEEHTLNVFEEALLKSELSGRSTSTMGVIGALFHDFGKSSKIRETLLGEGMQRGTKAHAELSQMYIQDMLLNKVYYLIENGKIPMTFIDSLAELVKNHHPQNARMKEDVDIKLVMQSDAAARKKEMKNLKLENINGD